MGKDSPKEDKVSSSTSTSTSALKFRWKVCKCGKRHTKEERLALEKRRRFIKRQLFAAKWKKMVEAARMQNKEVYIPWKIQMKVVVYGLSHVRFCTKSPGNCKYPSCGSFRQLLSHLSTCKVMVSGNCRSCKDVMQIVREHVKTCQNIQCRMPICKQMKMFLWKKGAYTRRESKADSITSYAQADSSFIQPDSTGVSSTVS